MGDNKDSTGLIILGIVLGAILALALLSRKTQVLQTVQPIQPQPIQWQPIDIPRVEDIKPMQIQTDPQLIQMASQLGKVTSQLEQATSKLQETKPMQPPVQIIQTDPQLIQMASQLGKATSQLEQATSKLQETIMKLQHNSMNNTPQQPLKIEIQQPVQPQPHVIVQPQPIQSQGNLQLQHTQQNNLQDSNTIYKNNEKWEIKRGADGRIKSLNIIRDVKKNN